MLLGALTIFFCGILIQEAISISNNVPDYYWRDYLGIIPLDAVPGGTDDAGFPTYIGQVYIKEFELLPATIYSDCRNASTTAYDKEIEANTNIKILCSENKNSLEWIPTKTGEIHLLTKCSFVVGGTEVGRRLNIGRVNHGGRIIMGKIHEDLTIPYDGKPVNFNCYEILGICSKPFKDPHIDVRYST